MRANAGFLRRAWLLLCAALALHVLDEATTGFLDIYNPTVASLRSTLGWFPMPQFAFGPWLTGLCTGVVLLSLLGLTIDGRARWVRPAACLFAGIMILNALGHTLGTLFGRTVESVRFTGPMPGFYSSPVMFCAAVYLLYSVRRSQLQT
ncbi:MAG: hypothetical protein IT168_27660 [Bryobacterales bacterium]|nr:hypothetical protein [Bryobacterales bacterium]